jgi:protein gp37
MGESTKIQWTDHTFNPWWGCQRVSPGCEHCYAETFSKRVGLKVWGPTSERRFFGDKHWREPLKWYMEAVAAGVRRRVFCASMADVFEDRPELVPYRAKLWNLIWDTHGIGGGLDWLLLTKRPENIARMIPWGDQRMRTAHWQYTGEEPWRNVWLGTTAEDQKRADERIPHLLAVPAAVRFVSYEPALDLVIFRKYLSVGGLHWLIVGGESGPGARKFDIRWAQNAIVECRDHGAACFVKQLGALPYEELFDGNYVLYRDTSPRRYWPDYDGFQVLQPKAGCIKDPKGGDWSEWPAELRVREWPKAVAA